TTVLSTDPSPTIFTYSKTFRDPWATCTTHTNTASLDDTAKSSDSKTVQVCVGGDLTVTKTATASFTRKYNWSINKSVDGDATVVQAQTTKTFNYLVTAQETGFNDSDWAVRGTITVTNPNDWETVTVNLADSLADTNGNCSI